MRSRITILALGAVAAGLFLRRRRHSTPDPSTNGAAERTQELRRDIDEARERLRRDLERASEA